jgi:tetratricopeptide (TPR) repeat protein
MVDASERNLGNEDDAPASTEESDGSVQWDESGIHGEGMLTPVRLEPGEVVPGTRYRIVRWLGTGSMGMVYEGAHVDIERRVALKILRADKDLTIDAAATFRREARTASKIGSPNIIEIVDFAQLPDGRLLFAMELLEGNALAKLVSQAPIPPERLIPILRQMCKGLAAAHHAGVVHRDIKPDNVMLASKEGREDFVKLVDFGISSLLASGQAIETAPAGTPFYMAPEQIEGHSYDGRVDLYAVGCTAYALMTGRPPYLGKSIEQVFDGHLEKQPKSIRGRSPDAGYSAALETVIMKCLAKDAEERYENAAELEAALCEAQIDSGIRTAWDDLPLPKIDEARRESLARRMPKPQEAKGRGWLWLLGAAALVAAGFAGTLAMRPDPSSVAQHDLVDDVDREAKDAAAQIYFVYPPAEDPSKPTAYTKVLELEGMDAKWQPRADTRAGELRKDFASTLVRLGDEYWEREGGQPFAVDYYAQALVFDSDAGRARERTYLTLGQISEFARRAAESDFTEAELRGARVLQALASDDEDTRRERLQEAIDSAPETMVKRSELRRLAKHMGVRPPAPVAEGTTGEPPDPVTETGPDETGTDETGEVPEVESTGGGPAPSERDPDAAKQLTKQAKAAASRGASKQAERLLHNAIDKDRKYAPALYELAELYFDAADYNRAADYGKKAIRIQPRNAKYRLLLGQLYEKMLRYPEAREQYQRAGELGSAAAKKRLAKLDAKTGG